MKRNAGASWSKPAHAAVPSEFVSSLGSGHPLDPAARVFFEPRFGIDLGHVRIHADAEAAASARVIQARAYTLGNTIVFGAGQYRPETEQGKHLLAHELTHVLQQADSGGTLSGRVQRDEDEVGDPIATWQQPRNSLLMVFADDRLIILPAAPLVRVADPESLRLMQSSSAHMTTDLGALLEVPSVGAGGTRIFRAGRRAALIIDAGSDPAGRIPAAVYLNEFQGAMANLGVTSVSEIRVIHVHQDHVSEIPTIVANSRVSAQRVSIPAQYLGVNAAIRGVVAALTSTTDAGMVARGFGAGWTPANPVSNRGGTGDVLRFGYMLGELRVEAIALRSALRTTATTPDLASFLTRITRPADQASVVILGDLRGRDLAAIRTAMETERSGSWNEFFSGVTTLSGFSHHAGRLEDRDVAGLMSLLDATMLRQGRLRVVEQTTVTRHAQTRTDTMELLERMGVELAVAELPNQASTSGAGASRSSLYARGPAARIQNPAANPLRDGLVRMERLRLARDTIITWRPWIEETGGARARQYLESLLPEIERSSQTLSAALRNAAEAALRVRAGGTTTAAGGRDYSSTGGARGAAFVAALNAVPAATTAETMITPGGFEQLQRLRALPAEEIPLRVALHAALVRGEYSDRAFAHMLAALEPDTRIRLLTGRRGGPSPRLVAFERVRAEFHFRQSVYSGDAFSIPSSWSRRQQRAAAGLVYLQLALELWNNVVQPLLEARSTAARTFRGYNLVPFVRRLLFWDQMGVQPTVVGVIDPTFGSPRYERNRDTVLGQLQSDALSALYFEAPVVSDLDVIRFGVWLSYHVRNYDEFATLFIDSGQDAIRWRSSDTEGWEGATWSVRAGRYETSGENHVEESWHEHPGITRLMRVYVRRIIQNTSTLLENWRTAGSLNVEQEAQLGRLEIGSGDRPLYETTLRTTAAATDVEVQPQGTIGAIHPTAARRLVRHVTWWSPPRFMVYGTSGDYTEVSGANYDTYAILRSLESERHTSVIAGGTIGADRVQTIGNERGTVWIRSDLLNPRPGSSVRPPGPALVAPPGDAPSPSQRPSRVQIGPLDPGPRDELSPGSPGGAGLTVRF